MKIFKNFLNYVNKFKLYLFGNSKYKKRRFLFKLCFGNKQEVVKSKESRIKLKTVKTQMKRG